MRPTPNDPGAVGAHGAGIDNAGRRLDTTQHTEAIEISEIRFARAVARLHRLGPRPLYQLLAELSAARMLRVEIEAMVDRYVARLDRDLLYALSDNRYPSAPLHLIEITYG
jgi:hypothetical protein